MGQIIISLGRKKECNENELQKREQLDNRLNVNDKGKDRRKNDRNKEKNVVGRETIVTDDCKRVKVE